MPKDCGDAAETVWKDYGSSADIVRNMGGPAADATSKCTPGPPYITVYDLTTWSWGTSMGEPPLCGAGADTQYSKSRISSQIR